MTYKKNDFKWGPEQQQAFEQIKWDIVRATAPWPVWAGQDVKMCSMLQPGWIALPGVSGRKHQGRLQSISSPLSLELGVQSIWGLLYSSWKRYWNLIKGLELLWKGLVLKHSYSWDSSTAPPAPQRLPVLDWVFKGRVFSTCHAAGATWNK